MNAQNLIKQAMLCFGQKRPQQGKELLKQAANMGSVSAILFYADVIFKEDKQSAYLYLEQQWQRGVKGTLHRRALMKCFFDPEFRKQNLIDIFIDLHREAMDGGLQSLIALISVLSDDVNVAFYKALLKQLEPDLYKQLLDDSPLSPAAIPQPTENELADSFVAAINSWHKLNVNVLAPIIDLKVAKSALSEIECKYMMLRFGTLLQPSQIVDPITGEAKQNPYRTGSMVAIVPEYLDWVVLAIEWKMAAFAGLPRQNGEVMNLIHYNEHQGYLPHYDVIVGDSASLETQLRNGGQRRATVLCYLNTVPEGGETEFPKLGVKVKAQAGDMLMFNNVDDNGKVLSASYHSGLPVLVGDKWVLSKWTRQGVTDYGSFVYC